jgi:hypothetical protein
MERLVHICNGDSTADTLSLADLPGDIRVWADALDEGPLLPVSDEEHYKVRTAFWASRHTGGPSLADMDRAVDDANAEELVLWYEHDLFDQLALCRLLSRLARRGLPQTLTIVSIDRHPAHPNFLGLGQLEPVELAELWPRRTPLSRDAIDEAITTWIAVTAADPRALPFLTRGVHTGGELMTAVQANDPRYPITDGLLLHTLQTFAACGFVEGVAPGTSPAAFREVSATITTTGRQALAGAIDRVAEVGIDTWRGGVHLQGRGPVWRWDSAQRKLIER